MVMIMTKGWDYVSELRSTVGLLFISQVIYEHGVTRWNDIDSGKLLIRAPEPSVNSTSSHIEAKQENMV
jgi:hypothetical protein